MASLADKGAIAVTDVNAIWRKIVPTANNQVPISDNTLPIGVKWASLPTPPSDGCIAYIVGAGQGNGTSTFDNLAGAVAASKTYIVICADTAGANLGDSEYYITSRGTVVVSSSINSNFDRRVVIEGVTFSNVSALRYNDAVGQTAGMYCNDCTFQSGITEQAQPNRDISFTNCNFGGSVLYNLLGKSNGFSFVNCRMDAGLTLTNSTINNPIYIENCTISDGILITGLNSSQIHISDCYIGLGGSIAVNGEELILNINHNVLADGSLTIQRCTKSSICSNVLNGGSMDFQTITKSVVSDNNILNGLSVSSPDPSPSVQRTVISNNIIDSGSIIISAEVVNDTSITYNRISGLLSILATSQINDTAVSFNNIFATAQPVSQIGCPSILRLTVMDNNIGNLGLQIIGSCVGGKIVDNDVSGELSIVTGANDSDRNVIAYNTILGQFKLSGEQLTESTICGNVCTDVSALQADLNFTGDIKGCTISDNTFPAAGLKIFCNGTSGLVRVTFANNTYRLPPGVADICTFDIICNERLTYCAFVGNVLPFANFDVNVRDSTFIGNSLPRLTTIWQIRQTTDCTFSGNNFVSGPGIIWGLGGSQRCVFSGNYGDMNKTAIAPVVDNNNLVTGHKGAVTGFDPVFEYGFGGPVNRL